jgi:Na+-transporting NADH:ubiquinone oxidoreductase subunit D
VARPLKRTAIDPLWAENPITMQALGVCSALAVTVELRPALVMGVAVIAVMSGTSLIVSLLRGFIPRRIRILTMLTVVASLVIVVDLILRAYMWDLSRQLSIFVGLIITNCIVLGRAEAFALGNPPGRALIDAAASGLGYAWILAIVAALREVLGSGRLLGIELVPAWAIEAGYVNNGIMVLAPGAFFLVGLIVWVQRALGARTAER